MSPGVWKGWPQRKVGPCMLWMSTAGLALHSANVSGLFIQRPKPTMVTFFISGCVISAFVLCQRSVVRDLVPHGGPRKTPCVVLVLFGARIGLWASPSTPGLPQIWMSPLSGKIITRLLLHFCGSPCLLAALLTGTAPLFPVHR